MEQKVIKIGNSVGVILPQPIQQAIDIRVGDKLLVKSNGKMISLTPKEKKRKTLAQDVDLKFMKMVDDFITQHEDALRELAKR